MLTPWKVNFCIHHKSMMKNNYQHLETEVLFLSLSEVLCQL